MGVNVEGGGGLFRTLCVEFCLVVIDIVGISCGNAQDLTNDKSVLSQAMAQFHQ